MGNAIFDPQIIMEQERKAKQAKQDALERDYQEALAVQRRINPDFRPLEPKDPNK